MLSKKLHAQLKDHTLNVDQQQQVIGGYREIPFAIEPTTRVRWDEVIIRFTDEEADLNFRPAGPNNFGRGGNSRLFRPII